MFWKLFGFPGKSKKIVLTVLMLNLDEDLVFVRACNLEVSMLAGSLCAER